jgi:hypothetical protein
MIYKCPSQITYYDPSLSEREVNEQREPSNIFGLKGKPNSLGRRANELQFNNVHIPLEISRMATSETITEPWARE